MIKQPHFVDQRVRYALVCRALPSAPARVCEVGVGGGWLLQYLHELGYDVHGCDIGLESLPSGSPVRSRVLQASGDRLPFPDSTFDATYSCDVLEHVYPEFRSAFLAEMVRVTKPGGIVAVTAFFHNTVSFRLWGAAYRLLRGNLPDWYTEHVTIPLPSEGETFAYFKRTLIGVHHVRYQRALNLFVMWLQSVAPRQRVLAHLFNLPRILVPTFDVLGKTTSAFFVGTKPECVVPLAVP